jgi:hypothetical protein
VRSEAFSVKAVQKFQLLLFFFSRIKQLNFDFVKKLEQWTTTTPSTLGRTTAAPQAHQRAALRRLGSIAVSSGCAPFTTRRQFDASIVALLLRQLQAAAAARWPMPS